MAERSIQVDSMEQIHKIFGSFDANAKEIELRYGVKLSNRNGDIKVCGDDHAVDQAMQAIETLLRLPENDGAVGEQTLRYVTTMVSEGAAKELQELTADAVAITVTGKPVRARTVGQKQYVEQISSNTIVLGVGPAGTGKTYLAVAMAVKAFKAHQISRIILTRPAVEAGEKLGFLPGDLQDKVDPYLRPLYDSLYEMLGGETVQRLMEKGTIEVAPLAYMRGRTLDEAFIILDEAQNTTPEQIKMFLTRLGNQSKMVITGDITQIDLPDVKRSGLVEAMKVLKNIDDISIHRFTEKDVVRHKLVQEIIGAYEKYQNNRERNQNERRK